MQVVLNSKSVEAPEGITILELARREGIQIPTLCNDEELNPFGSCWVCAVKVEGRRGFVTSCGTKISPGMIITTDSDEIKAARKMALELLISNHYADCEAPCKVACPDHVDIQSYVSLIANGKYHEAVKVIKETLPMPLSIGRVCPAFCEEECRRQIVEEAIAIRQLKRFAADEDLNDYWQYIPETKPKTGKKVAIIGGGPSGLTCGYYLSIEGHDVDLFEAEEACGGWLRYGIPEYRLPKAILDKEIELMCMSGMKIHTGKVLGRDVFLSQLNQDYDAVYLAIGAQNAVPMPVPGSDLTGCFLGVDFLKAHAKGNTPQIGQKVAIVGGGNTAIDCARTCIRLGAEVTVIYRRTKAEMPAEDFEIEAAEHEGVNFLFLCNPVEYAGTDGKLAEVKIEKMRLGEPDKSGRRRPEPTGEFFTEHFDSIIAAISQVPEVQTFAEKDNEIDGDRLAISRWQTAIVNQENMYSGLGRIFAGGDFQRGAATAIEAIADGRKASEAIDSFLRTGELPKARFVFDSKKAKKVSDVDSKEYDIFTRLSRVKMREIPLEKACGSFQEVELGFNEAEARAEAARCIECGCQVNESCALRDYCSQFEVEIDRFLGSICKHPIDYSHPFIVRDANKCINCGRCIRTCAEIQGAGVLGFIYRGFSAVMAPEFGESLTKTGCLACGKCIDVCPVGALVERNLYYKLNPHPKDSYRQNCGLCGVGCDIEVQVQASEIALISTPKNEPGFNGKNLCFKGRFGWQCQQEELKLPLIKLEDEYQQISWQDALELLQTRLELAQSRSVEISPHVSLEEMLIAERIAKTWELELTADPSYFSFSDPYLDIKPKEDAFGRLKDYQEYVVVGELNQSLLTLIRLEQRKGKKLTLVLYPKDSPFTRFADENLDDLHKLPVSPHALYIYNQNRISEKQAHVIWETVETQQIMVTTDYQNHSGFLHMAPRATQKQHVDFALCFGKEPFTKAAFSVAISSYQPEECSADMILPNASYLQVEAMALGDMGKISHFVNPQKSVVTNELLRVFYMLGMISPATADIPHWNALAQDRIRDFAKHEPALYQSTPEKGLRDVPLSSDAAICEYLSRLFELRKTPLTF
nr:formate dehydrogenase major subunit [Candidatus Cloacimonadota bacterium]